MKNKFVAGQHNVIDDITGFKRKSGSMKKLEGTQKGLITHYSSWNPKQPQLYIKARGDKQQVKNVRDRQEDNFITTAVSRDDL